MSARLPCTHPSNLVCLLCHQKSIRGPIPRGVWEMTKTVYGLEEAPADFDEHFGKVSEDLCGEFRSLSLTRMMSEHAAFQSQLTGVMMCKNMDDGVWVGPDEALDRTLTSMGKILLLKTCCPQLGSERKIPRETVDQDRTGNTGQASYKTLRQFVVLCWYGEFQSCAFSWCAIGIESSG